MGISMLRCVSAQDEAQDGAMEKEWREPPGYLGEAVRRAKRIPRREPEPAQ
jgi:hypothetical protein